MENYTGSSSSSSSGIGSGKGMGSPKRQGTDIKGGERAKREDKVTSAIEQKTAQVPSVTFLTVAGVAMAGSLGFFLAGKRDVALFIGTWVPTILIMGNYNKIVKALENLGEGEADTGPYGGSTSYSTGGSTF